MGRQSVDQPRLFYDFRLENRVPADDPHIALTEDQASRALR